MTRVHATLENPALRGIGIWLVRSPQQAPEPLSAANIVSADSHWEIDRNIFAGRFPAHLRDFAPLVWLDEYWFAGGTEPKSVYPC